jgi:lysozyme
MQTGPRRPGLLHLWLTLGAVVALLLFALPATGRAGSGPSAASATPSPTMVGVMGSALRQTAQLTPAASQSTVCASGTPFQGIDVSYYQGSYFGGSINWTQVAQSGLSFAYARAADGTGFIDPDFQVNFRGIKAVGMKAGAYLFYEPNQDPTAQANELVTQLQEAGFAPGDLEPVFDIEVTDGQSPATIAANLQTSINVVQQALGATPVIYTGSWFWNPYVQSTSFGIYPLWIAYWVSNVSTSCPGLPNGWSTWSVWQYNDNSTVPGITVNLVDADESNGPKLPCYNGPRTTPSTTVRLYLPLVFNQVSGEC